MLSAGDRAESRENSLPHRASSADLFRREVMDAQSRRLHGEIIFRQTLPTKIVTAVITSIVLAAGFWIVLGSYARIETARGMLVPSEGYAKIFALRPGIVSSLNVKDNQSIKIGDTLAVIRVESPNAAGRMGTREELQLIQNQVGITDQQVALIEERSRGEVVRLAGMLDGLRTQLSAVKEQIGYRTEIIASMAKSLQQVQPVVERGFISKTEYERRRQTLLAAQEELTRLKQQEIVIKADMARTEADKQQAVLTGRSDRASAQISLETLHRQENKTEGESSYSVDAPIAGLVTALQTGVGRTVEQSVPLMVLVPEHAVLRADLFVPSRAIGFLKRGQEVRLLYDAFPYQRFGSHRGRIETVSRLAIAGSETGAPFEIKEPVYRVTVLLSEQDVGAYDKRARLQPGMTLVANIVLERQSFLDWMLAPLRAVQRRT